MKIINKILYTTLFIFFAVLFAMLIIGVVSFLIALLWPFIFIGVVVVIYFSINEIFNNDKLF
jgi:hypothetical protein